MKHIHTRTPMAFGLSEAIRKVLEALINGLAPRQPRLAPQPVRTGSPSYRKKQER
jgi:hypothetical protein